MLMFMFMSCACTLTIAHEASPSPSLLTNANATHLSLTCHPSSAPSPGNGILGQPVFEEYYVLHETPQHPRPPRMGFATIAGCGKLAAQGKLKQQGKLDQQGALNTQVEPVAILASMELASVKPNPRATSEVLRRLVALVALVALPGVLFGATVLRRAREVQDGAHRVAFWSTARAPLLDAGP